MVHVVIIIKYHNHFWCATLVDVVVSRVLPQGFVRISWEMVLYGQRIFKLLLCFWIFLLTGGRRAFEARTFIWQAMFSGSPCPGGISTFEKLNPAINSGLHNILNYVLFFRPKYCLIVTDSWQLVVNQSLVTDYYLAYFWKWLLLMCNNNY